MAAVVHHGGAGTTATAARAGVPQIIVPHYFDQYYWAERIHRTGLGTKAVSRNKLTGRKLAGAIKKSTSDPTYAHRAQGIARELQQKDPWLKRFALSKQTIHRDKAGWLITRTGPDSHPLFRSGDMLSTGESG